MVKISLWTFVPRSSSQVPRAVLAAIVPGAVLRWTASVLWQGECGSEHGKHWTPGGRDERGPARLRKREALVALDGGVVSAVDAARRRRDRDGPRHRLRRSPWPSRRESLVALCRGGGRRRGTHGGEVRPPTRARLRDRDDRARQPRDPRYVHRWRPRMRAILAIRFDALFRAVATDSGFAAWPRVPLPLWGFRRRD